MLNIYPPKFIYCPFCSQPLSDTVFEDRTFKHCQSCNWTYYPHVGTAACAVAIRGGKVLLVKRARDPYKHTWMFPAGFVSYGEHPAETVVRETAEETGLVAKVVKLIGVEQVDDDPRSPGHFDFFYKVKVSGRISPSDQEENSEISWFDLRNLPVIGWHSQRNIVIKLGGIFAK